MNSNDAGPQAAVVAAVVPERRLKVAQLTPDVYRAMSNFDSSIDLEPRLRELVKLRASVLSSLITEIRDLFVAKGADESVSNQTRQNDDELALTVAASAEYYGMLVAVYTGGNAAGDIQFAFTFPTGAACHFAGPGPHNGIASGSAADGEWIARLGVTSGVTNIPYGASATGLVATVNVHLITGANAGTLQLQWAQQTTNATATVLKAGSYMWLRRQS